MLGKPALAADARFADNTRRCANRLALDREISAVFGALPASALGERLLAANIAFGAVNSVADFAAHPQLRRAAIAGETGPIELVAPPVTVDGGEPTLGAVPALGQHTAELRRRFG